MASRGVTSLSSFMPKLDSALSSISFVRVAPGTGTGFSNIPCARAVLPQPHCCASLTARSRPLRLAPLLVWDGLAAFEKQGAFIRCVGVLNGNVHDAFLEDSLPPSAFTAECAALAEAAKLAVANFPGVDVCFVGDCQPALDCASNTHIFRESSSCGSLEYFHVKSHEGEFANEVVDVAAKLASKGELLGHHPLPDLGLWFSQGGCCLSRAGRVCRSLQGASELPDFFGGPLSHDVDMAGLSPSDLIRPFLAEPCIPPDTVAVRGPLRFRVASANVLTLMTLNDPDHGKASSSASGLAKRILVLLCLPKALSKQGCMWRRCRSHAVKVALSPQEAFSDSVPATWQGSMVVSYGSNFGLKFSVLTT